MVCCNAIDGLPCECQLDVPEILYWMQTIVHHLVKKGMNTITTSETHELNSLLDIQNVYIYLDFYLKKIENERNVLAESILNTLGDE